MDKPAHQRVLDLGCLILLISIFAAVVTAEERAGSVTAGPKTETPAIIPVTLGGKTIQAVVADTNKSRGRGLLGWETISEEQGMLLDFLREGNYAIHMETMKFPIDALWIDDRGTIRVIYDDLMPNSGLSYPSVVPCRYCLEIQAGFCKKYGVKMGDQVQFGRPVNQSR